ncbi:MAG: helix-turn-helix domain-containing protein, partial [Candidatus Pacebacteria bacterium]|nr:helix-turn-helix domain-containing protein [Candidatus Paceibacterota bacterium]
MKDKLIFDNKKYFSSRYAGKISGHTNDCVARFCRQGKIDGKKVGRTWYVEEKSLNDFIQENNLKKGQLKRKRSVKMAGRCKDSEKTITEVKVSQPQPVVSKTLKLSPIFPNKVFKKIAIAAIVPTLISLGGYFVRDANIHPIQIAKATTYSVAEVVVDTTDNLLIASSDYLLTSALSLKNSVDENSRYFNASVMGASDYLLTSASNAKLYLLTSAKHFNTRVNKTSQDTKASVIEAANHLLVSASNTLSSSQASVMDAVTQVVQSFNNTVNKAADSILSIFSKPEETPPLVQDLSAQEEPPMEENKALSQDPSVQVEEIQGQSQQMAQTIITQPVTERIVEAETDRLLAING